MNFIDVFNAVADAVGNKPANAPQITSYDNEPIDVGLDSLDMIIIVEVIRDIYGLPETDDFNIPVTSLRAVRNYMLENKKQDFDSVEAAMESVV